MNFSRLTQLTLTILVVIFGVGFFFAPTKVSAAACSSQLGGGNWSDGAKWTCTHAPTTGDTVTVTSGNNIILDQNATTTSVTIDNGATLSEDGNGRVLAVSTGWTNNGTFTAGNSTVKLTGAQTVTGNTTFKNFTIDPNITGRTITMTNATSTVTGIFTMDYSAGASGNVTLTNGTIEAQGDVIWDSSDAGTSNSTLLLIDGGATSQTLTSSNASETSGSFTTFKINKSSGTLYLVGTIRTVKNWTYVAGTVDAVTNNSSVVFVTQPTITGSHTLNNVKYDSNDSVTTRSLTISSGTTLTIVGTLTIDNSGTALEGISTGTLIAQGNVNIDAATFDPGSSANLLLTGSNSQALALTGGTVAVGGFASTTINKSGGTLTVSGLLRTTKNFTHSAGAVDWTTASSTLVFAGTSNFNPAAVATYDNVYFDTAGTVTLQNNLSVARDWTNNGSFTSGSNTVTFTGSGNSTVITGGVTAAKDFQNFTVNKSGSGIVQLSTNGLDVDGTLTVSSGTLNLNGQNLTTSTTCSITGIIKVLGTETLSCTPTYNAGSTIEFSGAGNATVSNFGSSFQNLTSTQAGKTIIFPSDTTTTVGDTLTLQGAEGNPILIKASGAGVDGEKTGHRATLSVSVSGTLDHLTVYDNGATGAASPLNSTNFTDGGNNAGWNVPPDLTLPNPGTIEFSNVTVSSITVSPNGASDETALADLPYQYHNITRGTYSGATSSISWTETGLTSNTSYTYEIGVQDLAGNRATSTTAATTTLPVGAIAVWAYPDSVSLPYRNNDNQTTSDLAHIGVVAYHSNGMSSVDFTIKDSENATILNRSVTTETLNPETGEMEYVLELSPATLTTDGTYTIEAVAVPTSGANYQLSNLTIFKDTATHAVWYVDDTLGNDTTGNGTYGNPFKTIDRAVGTQFAAASPKASSGDIVKVRNGDYALPDGQYATFTKYVTIMADTGQTPRITSNGVLRSPFFKFTGFTFTVGIINGVLGHHFWFDDDIFIGAGKDDPTNNDSAIRVYLPSGAEQPAGRYVVVENSTIHDFSVGVTATNGDYILRNNTIYDQTADGYDYDGSNILISGNIIHDTKLPPGGDQHNDFIASNTSSNQVVVRNNYSYDGDAQGNKFGGWNDGRDQFYSNVAFINNVMALGTGGSVNLRLEGITKGKRFDNILIEYNTIWNGSSVFIIESDVHATSTVVRNNIFGPTAAGSHSIVSIDYNCYAIAPSVGSHSIVGDPLFTDSSSWDFTLQSSSPCRNGATNSSGIPYDLNWNSRGAQADMGAYQYFTPDLIAPTPGTITFSNVTQTTITATTTATDNVALDPAPFQFHATSTGYEYYSGATSTAITLTGLTANTAYSFEVGVVDASGNWATSTIYATTTLANVPGTWTITASAGTNGTIDPIGEVSVTDGEDQSFTITPDSGYNIATLVIDDTPTATSTSYLFENVTANHTILATFSAIPVVTPEPEPIVTPPTSRSSSGSSIRRITPIITTPAFPPLITPLTFGMTSPAVRTLQQMLALDPTIYPNPQITGYYGALTRAAVARFQQKYGIATTPQTLGVAGPMTRAKLNSLYANSVSTPTVPVSPDRAAMILQLQTQLRQLIAQLQLLLQQRAR